MIYLPLTLNPSTSIFFQIFFNLLWAPPKKTTVHNFRRPCEMGSHSGERNSKLPDFTWKQVAAGSLVTPGVVGEKMWHAWARHKFLCKYLSHQNLDIMTWSIEYIPSQLTTSCDYELFLQLLLAHLLKFDSELVRRILPHLLFAWAIGKEVTPNPADRGGPAT